MPRKLKNGRWLVDVSVGYKLDGQRDRRQLQFKTKREAVIAEQQLLAKKSPTLITGRITLDDFLESVYWPNKQGLSPNTVQGYERDINLRIKPHLGRKNIEDISRYDVQEMISACSSRKVATNARETLSSILGLAVDLHMLGQNVAGLRYNYPPANIYPEDHYGQWLTTFKQHREFFEALRAADCPELVFRIAVLGLCFGLRKGEILGLDWEDVDLKARTIRVKQTYISGKGGSTLKEPKTVQSFRTIPMTGFAYEQMAAWALEKGEGPVIAGKNGRVAPATGKKWLQKFYDGHATIKRVTMASMRHSFATACIKAGIDVAVVSKWLGHKDVSTTYNRYVRPLLADLQDAVSVIDAAFVA